MICPKCGFEQPDDHAECARCGVLFARLAEIEAQRAAGTLFPAHPAPVSRAAAAEPESPTSWSETARALLFTWDTTPTPACSSRGCPSTTARA